MALAPSTVVAASSSTGSLSEACLSIQIAMGVARAIIARIIAVLVSSSPEVHTALYIGTARTAAGMKQFARARFMIMRPPLTAIG